jgi:hypothetical protein
MMLNRNWIESISRTVKLEQFEVASLKKLFRFVTTGSISIGVRQLLTNVYPMAYYFEMQSVLKYFRKVAFRRFFNIENVNDIFEAASVMGDDQLNNECISWLLEKNYTIEDARSCYFTGEVLTRLITSDLLKVESELCVVEMILNWKSRYDPLDPEIENMLENVRYPLMTKEEIERFLNNFSDLKRIQDLRLRLKNDTGFDSATEQQMTSKH